MKQETVLVKQARLAFLKQQLVIQEETIRHFENKCVEAIEAKKDTEDRILEIEAELEAHGIVNA